MFLKVQESTVAFWTRCPHFRGLLCFNETWAPRVGIYFAVPPSLLFLLCSLLTQVHHGRRRWTSLPPREGTSLVLFGLSGLTWGAAAVLKRFPPKSFLRRQPYCLCRGKSHQILSFIIKSIGILSYQGESAFVWEPILESKHLREGVSRITFH